MDACLWITVSVAVLIRLVSLAHGLMPRRFASRTSGRIRTEIYGFDLKSSFFNKIQ